MTNLGLDKDLDAGRCRRPNQPNPAENELFASEARLRLLLEHAPAALAMFDENMCYLVASRRWMLDFGLGDRDIIGRSHYEVFPELPSRWKEVHRRGLSGEHISVSEDQFERSDGTTQWLRWEVRPFRVSDSPTGSVGGIVIFSEDITQRKRAEVALRESESRYRLISENGSDVIWLFDLQTNRFTYVSPSVERLRGFTVSEVLQQSMMEALDAPSYQMVAAGLQARLAAFAAGDVAMTTQTHEVVQTCKDGGLVPTEVVTTLIVNERGDVTHIQGVTRNISERKRAQEAIRESRAKLEAAMASMTDAVVISDVEGRFVDFNAAFATFHKFKDRDDCAKTLSEYPRFLDMFLEDGTLAKLDEWAVPRALRGEAVTNAEYRLRRKDTGETWFGSYSFGPIRDEVGNIVGSVVVARDITKRKHLEIQRRELEAQLQQAQKMESVGRLAGGVAHDFNNMLGAILGHTEMAMDVVAQDDPLRTELVGIQRAALRSAELIRQLLAFARKQTVSPKVLNLNQVITGTLKMMQRLIGEDIELEWCPNPRVWSVKADPSQIDQILANLCVNARDAIVNVGKITIEVRNEAFDAEYCTRHPGRPEGEYVLLTVRDNGCGMGKDVLAHLFEPFFTTKGVGKGTGLGLATVYGIVRQNNGFIDVDSEVGQGTSFLVYLPRHTGPCEAPAPDARGPLARGHEVVLLVEDEQAMLVLTTRMLERLGYAVIAAGSPFEAIRLAAQHEGRIDLLVTDVVMPEMNGRELTDSLMQSFPTMKSLYMSGYTADVIAQHGVLDAVRHFIQKPFSLRDLADAVRIALAESPGQAVRVAPIE